MKGVLCQPTGRDRNGTSPVCDTPDDPERLAFVREILAKRVAMGDYHSPWVHASIWQSIARTARALLDELWTEVNGVQLSPRD